METNNKPKRLISSMLFSIQISRGQDSLCISFALYCGIQILMIWKFLKQNILFPKGLN